MPSPIDTIMAAINPVPRRRSGAHSQASFAQPTPAQIEHGWELHFNSLVFESYGFAPRAAMDGAGLHGLLREIGKS
jgi:membrane dipeptidase